MTDNDWTRAIFDLLMALLSVATLALTIYVIPWMQAHISAKRLQTAQGVAAAAAHAVEQMGGTDKLFNALQRARDLGAQKGIRLDDQQWRTLIEQAVLSLHTVEAAVASVASPQPGAEAAATVVTDSEREPDAATTVSAPTTDPSVAVAAVPSKRGTAARKAGA